LPFLMLSTNFSRIKTIGVGGRRVWGEGSKFPAKNKK